MKTGGILSTRCSLCSHLPVFPPMSFFLPGSHFAFNYCISLISPSRDISSVFPYLSWLWHVWRVLECYFVDCPSVFVWCFFHDCSEIKSDVLLLKHHISLCCWVFFIPGGTNFNHLVKLGSAYLSLCNWQILGGCTLRLCRYPVSSQIFTY